MTQAAFLRRVTAGTFPRPSYAAGAQSPRWDRLALDASFEGGADSTDAETAFRGLADEIAAEGSKGRTHRPARAGRRHGQGIPLRPAQAQAAR
jgi:hypothetical protein